MVHRAADSNPPAACNSTGLPALSILQCLDLSDNPLQQLHPQQLPASLKELLLAGCQLTAVPPSLPKHLPALEQLVLAANSLTSADAIFSCQQLVHVGLAYNHISTLVSTAAATDTTTKPGRQSSSSAAAGDGSTSSALNSSNIMCLDLSHNDVSDLTLILEQLQQLPKLRALQLQGNPVALLPHYKSALLKQLPQLVYLDGQVRMQRERVYLVELYTTCAQAVLHSCKQCPAAI